MLVWCFVLCLPCATIQRSLLYLILESNRRRNRTAAGLFYANGVDWRVKLSGRILRFVAELKSHTNTRIGGTAVLETPVVLQRTEWRRDASPRVQWVCQVPFTNKQQRHAIRATHCLNAAPGANSTSCHQRCQGCYAMCDEGAMEAAPSSIRIVGEMYAI